MDFKDMPEKYYRRHNDSGSGSARREFQEGEIDPRTLRGNARLDYLAMWRNAYGQPMSRNEMREYVADPLKAVPFLPTELEKAAAQQELKEARNRLGTGGTETSAPPKQEKKTEPRPPKVPIDSPLWDRLKLMGSRVAAEILGKRTPEQQKKAETTFELQRRVSNMKRFARKAPRPPENNSGNAD